MKNFIKSITSDGFRWRTQLWLGRWLQWAERRLGREPRASRHVLVSFSYLFRDVDDYLAPIQEIYRQQQQPLRILCAGCATGQGAYSIAIVCHDLGIPASIVGVDLSPAAIAVAERGRYDLEYEKLRSADSDTRAAAEYIDHFRSYFQTSPADHPPSEVRPAIRRMVDFDVADVCKLNYRPEFDLVVCRKMLYYLAASEQERALQALRSVLKPECDDSRLILDGYTLKQPTIQACLAKT